MNSRPAARGFDARVSRALDFSILFFSSNEAGAQADKYRLVIEAARFADQHGFAAVWIPERHFHPFGGLYPNPSVLGAALAMVTKKVRIRAGSVVLPLQNPVRVAEEWAVVDNLSGGRVDVAFAQGWNVRDFVLAPTSYTDRLPILFGGIETVKRLWLGETVELPDGRGNAVRVRVYPQPQQPQLEIWLTCSGAAERFVEAGKIGANVLTGLLFQSVEQLDEKLHAYRQARAEHGFDPQAGQVTIMLHTFVGEDFETVKETIRAPFTEYLKTSTDLYAQTHKKLADLTDNQREKILRFAFERYFQTAALFGTPETCMKMVNRLKAIGVTEIAALLDFGVPTLSVLAHMKHLNVLRQRAAIRGEALGAAPAPHQDAGST